MKRFLITILSSLFLISCDSIDKPDMLYVYLVKSNSSYQKDLVDYTVCTSYSDKYKETCFYLIDYKGKFTAGDRVKLVKDE